MLGLVCLAWLYLRKLKTRRGGGPLRSPAQRYGNGAWRGSRGSAHPWHRADLSVHVVFTMGWRQLGPGTQVISLQTMTLSISQRKERGSPNRLSAKGLQTFE